MTDSQATSTVEVPAEVLDQIEQRVPKTEFEDASAYVTYLLEEVLFQLDQSNDLSSHESVDEAQVEERLKSLGYLNE